MKMRTIPAASPNPAPRLPLGRLRALAEERLLPDLAKEAPRRSAQQLRAWGLLKGNQVSVYLE